MRFRALTRLSALAAALGLAVAGLTVAAVTSPVVPTASAAAPPDWQVVFADDFAGAGGVLPPSWAHRTGSNNALAGTDGAGNLRVKPNGFVTSSPVGNANGYEIPFEAGRTYSVEARIKMPYAKTSHSALWLRTNDANAVGEIDVIESWGNQPNVCEAKFAFYWKYLSTGGGEGDVKCARGANRGIPQEVPDLKDVWRTYKTEFTYAGPTSASQVSKAYAAPTKFFVGSSDGSSYTQYYSTNHSPTHINGSPTAEYLLLQNKVDSGTANPGESTDMLVDWVKVKIKGAALQKPVISPIANSFYNGTTAVEGTIQFDIHNAPLTTWSCTLDGAAFSCPNPYLVNVGPIADGFHTFTITATNPAGSDTWSSTWAGGQRKPVITYVSTTMQNGSGAVDHNIKFSIANKPLTTWSCTFDGAPIGCSNPENINIGGVGDGYHLFKLTATNYAGSTSYEHQWAGGQPAPVVTKTFDNATNGSHLQYYRIDFAIQNQPLTSWSCTLDGVAFSCPNPFSVTFGPLTHGGHSFRIYFNNYGGSTWSGADFWGGL